MHCSQHPHIYGELQETRMPQGVKVSQSVMFGLVPPCIITHGVLEINIQYARICIHWIRNWPMNINVPILAYIIHQILKYWYHKFNITFFCRVIYIGIIRQIIHHQKWNIYLRKIIILNYTSSYHMWNISVKSRHIGFNINKVTGNCFGNTAPCAVLLYYNLWVQLEANPTGLYWDYRGWPYHFLECVNMCRLRLEAWVKPMPHTEHT